MRTPSSSKLRLDLAPPLADRFISGFPIDSGPVLLLMPFGFPSRWPSRPGEFHPEPLTDPDVTLSSHPARATPRKPTGFRQDKEFLRLPVDSILTWVTCPLRSTDITPLPRYYWAVRPWSVHQYFRPRGSSTCTFSFAITGQVLTFRTKARIRVTPPLHRTPHGQ
jgi:hypothetical protein